MRMPCAIPGRKPFELNTLYYWAARSVYVLVIGVPLRRSPDPTACRTADAPSVGATIVIEYTLCRTMRTVINVHINEPLDITMDTNPTLW